MIFQHTHEWIFGVSPATGQPKIHTRRIIKPGQKLVQHVGDDGFDLPVVISQAGKRLHYSGQRVAVQPGHSMKGDGKIYILDIQQQDVRNITNNDARAEGFYHALDFLIWWVGINDISVTYPVSPPTQCSQVSLPYMAVAGPGYNDQYHHLNWSQWTDQVLMKRPNSHYQAFAYLFEAIEQE